jgi:integrase
MRPTGHIRERSHGSWELRYSLRTDPATGKRRTATATVKGDRRAAEKELRRLLRTLDTGEHVDPIRMTVRQWLATWLATVREEVSPKSHERYSEIVNNFLAPELGALEITKLAPAHIQAAYTKWATEGRRDGKPGGLSPRTRRHIHRILWSALARAVEQQLLARNPADTFKKRLPKVESRPMATLSAEQAHRLLAAIRHSRVYWPVLLALATGMRRGEILALRWRNVDLERGVLQVVESLEQTKLGLRFKAPKNNKSRTIALPAFTLEDLRWLKREQAEELLALGIRQTGETLVCGRGDGESKSPLALSQEFARLVSRTKDIPRVRFHDLRHSHATQLLRDGVHAKVMSQRLGHSSVAITLDLYSHVDDQMESDAAARLDVAFRLAKTGAKTQK